MKHILGVDVAKAKLDVALRLVDGDIAAKWWTFPGWIGPALALVAKT
ncbi:MAG: hypothetical protein IPM02_13350 [Betaproteobacteria bacterium]|nr:hypothetical protein [Betaproteobacteria bacterium]